MKKEYEVVWEVFNLCANNQMRDVFIEEIELDEDRLEDYIRGKIKDKDLTLKRSVQDSGTIIYDIDASGVRERMSFTEF